ncbi:MutS-related protein [Kribbella sp. CA-253562]|uniref:MutS-related protein n=1 Tax=Kribbella sp. CA-253562 TaxID=3239942 RepID=UPI003D8C0061
MKAFLMFSDRDFDLESALPSNAAELVQDLELDALFDAMADGDPFLRQVAVTAVLSSLDDPDGIEFRQAVLRDCLQQPAVVRELYATAVEAIEQERKTYRYFRSPDGILDSSGKVLELLMTYLGKLRAIADSSASRFRSEGFRTFFRTIATDLDDEYFRTVEDHLQRLKFRHGLPISAKLGIGNVGVDYVLRRPQETRRTLRTWLARPDTDSYTLQIPDQDDSAAQALAELRERGINLVANAIAQSADHVTSFFELLRTELAFYVGCLNLYERLSAKGEPTCFPTVAAPGRLLLSANGLYDPCLSLGVPERAVGNVLAADGRSLIVVTGANQGGKSTFLRSVGVAHVMTQAGMFAPAESLTTSICRGLFTHFPREEDETMTSGKLDEELARMSEIADRIRPDALLLCNESFASTNEREGSELAGDVLRAMVESGIRVVFVTHLFHLAQGLYAEGSATALFLRAERLPGGQRTFRLSEGEPKPSSHGEDLYHQIFTTRQDG